MVVVQLVPMMYVCYASRMAAANRPEAGWAYPLTRTQYERFLVTVAEELDYLGLEGDRIPDVEGDLSVRLRGDPDFALKLNLKNTAQQAATCPESTWGDLVRQVYGNATQISKLTTTPLAVETLRVRLYSPDHLDALPSMPQGGPVFRKVAGDIVETMVVDHPSVVALLLRQQLETLGLTEDEAWRIAEENTSRNPISVERVDIGRRSCGWPRPRRLTPVPLFSGWRKRSVILFLTAHWSVCRPGRWCWCTLFATGLATRR